MRKQRPGSLRIGVRRELKKALEASGAGEAAVVPLHDRARDIRRNNWKNRKIAGLALSPRAYCTKKRHLNPETITFLSLAPALECDLERLDSL